MPGIRHAICGASLSLLAATATAQAPVTPSPTPSPALSGEELVGQLMRAGDYAGPVVATPQGQDGKPDLTGFWRPLREKDKPGGNMGKDEPNFVLPFTAAGQRALLYSQNHTVDPEAVCILGGIPRHNASGLPFEVLHTPQRIAYLYHYNTSRRIPIGDKLTLDAHPVPSYFGTAVAHWEDATLVIETTGLRDSARDQIWLDENGNPTSDQTHVIERWSRPDFHHLKLDMTVTDPKYYSRPIRFQRTWLRAPAGVGLLEYACNESNLATENIGPGAGPVGPDGKRGFGYEDPLPATPPGPEAYE